MFHIITNLSIFRYPVITVGIPLVLFIVLSFFASCYHSDDHDPTEAIHATGFLNLHDSVKYVGMTTCRQCHADIHTTFSHTGMGKSFDLASKNKSSGNFINHKPVYDNRFDYYYYPFWAGDSLYLREFRLSGNDTLHKREQKINYIIGSGQHTNSHLYDINGYIFQAPFTWYSQEKKWDLPPGFETGSVTRFSRIISLECMSCHNAYPDFIEGSENRFKSILSGIDCERCHGPGSLHVQEKQAGKIIDTSRFTDYTIVNPRNLSPELQMEICQRCHLQGNAILKPGKTFFDFRPGMHLREVFDVFMPRYQGDQNSFIMASHVERLKMSKCYQASDHTLNCISCHNPHVSVTVTGTNAYNLSCQPCHSNSAHKLCTETLKSRNARQDNCVACHMPASGTSDIPHVSTHDHYIRKPQKNNTTLSTREFAGLLCMTDPNPGSITMAKAYLNYFEKFDPKSQHLDSAKYWLQKSKPGDQHLMANIQLLFLQQNFSALTKYAHELEINMTARKDAWTCYRMGEAFQKNNNYPSAEIFYRLAVEALPHSPEFRNKLAATYIQNKKMSEAESLLKEILEDLPVFVPALNNLAFLKAQQQEPDTAKILLEKALKLDPDYELALSNLASWHANFGNKNEAMKYARQLIQKHPGNPDYIHLLNQIRRK